MHPAPRPTHSYRSDPAVPAFDDSRILLVMDAECALCSAAARRIARMDRHDRVRIAPVQSPLGRALLIHYALSPDDPDTWLTVSEGHARGSLDATMHLFPSLSRWAMPLKVLGLLPRGMRDWIYARIARNRYAVFGHADMCALPDPALQRKLIK